MGAIKANNYSTLDRQLSLIARALAHPARIEMIKTLRESGSARNVDFARSLRLSKTTVKDHIGKLKDAQLVTVRYFPHHYEISLKEEPLLEIAHFTGRTADQ